MDCIAVALLDHIRIADGLDIAIVSVFVYILLVWLRDRASRSMAIVVLSLGVLFLIARWLDLYLTIIAFRYGIVGILLAMVVVFQQDIRHGFEQLTSKRWFRRSSTIQPSQPIVDSLIKTVVDLAEKHIGALLVFPGRQPLDRHLHGGVEVDAQISEPLLKSIFHPKSPGHDGAVLIEHHRIVSLGLHLPLTAQVDKVLDGGTRHAAALGLAECSDAIVVAVSEERGTITFAKDGELTIVDSEELSALLRKYFDEQNDVTRSDQKNHVSGWGTKLLAVIFATAFWWMFALQTDTVQRTFIVPIEFRNLPEGFQIADPKPTYAEVTMSGPENSFTLLDPAIVAVSLDLKDSDPSLVTTGSTASNLTNVPEGLETVSAIPQRISVTLRPKSDAT